MGEYEDRMAEAAHAEWAHEEEADELRKQVAALQARAEAAEALLREAQRYVQSQCGYAYDGPIAPYEQRARDLDTAIDALGGGDE